LRIKPSWKLQPIPAYGVVVGCRAALTGVAATVLETLEGTSETVGEASVDQTINIVGDLANAVAAGNQVPVGSGDSTVAVNIDPQQPGPVKIDVFADDYGLVKGEGSDLPEGVEHFNNLFSRDDDEEDK